MSIQKKLQVAQLALEARKTEKNKFGNYNYRKVETILEGLKPILKAEGMTVMMSDDVVCVGDNEYVCATASLTCTETGDEVSATAWARISQVPPKGMQEPQSTGSSSTYARKYALCGLLAIDDGLGDPDMINEHKGEQLKTVQGITAKKQKIAEICKAVNKCESDSDFAAIMSENSQFITEMRTELPGTKYEDHLNSLIAHCGMGQVSYANLGPVGYKLRSLITGLCDGKSLTEQWECFNEKSDAISKEVGQELRPIQILSDESHSAVGVKLYEAGN